MQRDVMQGHFPGLSEVTVTDEYFNRALELDTDNMLLLDPDRLLAGFRETAACIAGYDEKQIEAFTHGKARYGGGWEDALIGGHTLGHYITALAQASVNPALCKEKQEAVKERLDLVLSALLECEELTKGTAFEGYLFGATLPTEEFKKNPALQFDNIENNKADIFTEAWVPWYTMHKILAGLNDAFAITRDPKAINLANALGNWISKRALSWDEATRKMVLSIEYGGMNEALYRLYSLNKELFEAGSTLCEPGFEKFWAAAHTFDEEALFKQVKSGKGNIFNNVHANTTIPKFLGALARYECDNSEVEYLEYAKAFWDIVIERHTYVTGGNSENEHFGEDFVLDRERTHVNNETCNTYNMLKLSRGLFAATGKKVYADYYENTLINAIMASQDHKTGMTMYFQPMATGYQKVFGTLEGTFWCCNGTGMENFTKLQDSIYFICPEAIVVNLYIASKLFDDTVCLEQSGDLSKSDTVSFTVKPVLNADKKDIILRIPTWTDIDKIVLKIDGSPCDIKGATAGIAVKDGYLHISKDVIAANTNITLTLPKTMKAHNLPDGKNTYAFTYGPYVLSARLGTDKQATTKHGIQVTVPAQKAVESDIITVTCGKTVDEFVGEIEKHLTGTGNPPEFKLTGTDKEYIFTPHYDQDTESYGIYWRFETK